MKEILIAENRISLSPFNDYIPQIEKGTAILRGSLEITSSNSLEIATINLNKGKTLTNLITRRVEEICRPLKDMKRQIDEAQREVKSHADEIIMPITKAISEVEAKILAYHKVLKEKAEVERRKQEEETRKEQERLDAERKKAEVEAKEKGEDPPVFQEPQIIIKTVIEPPKVKGLTTLWKYEITNEDQVPREFCSIDPGKLQAAVRAGFREIPGVRIFSEESIRKT